MKSFKKVAVTILAAVMMLLISTTVFAADSPVKTSFNASLTKKVSSTLQLPCPSILRG